MAGKKPLMPDKQRPYIKNAALFVAIIILITLIWITWNTWLSPTAQTAKRMERQSAKYQEQEQRHAEAIANDTYGGQTPQETLELFIQALEERDMERASKYFIIDHDNTQETYEVALESKKDEEIEDIIKTLKNLERIEDLSIPQNTAEFGERDADGSLLHSVTLVQIKKQVSEPQQTSAVIWKIEKM